MGHPLVQQHERLLFVLHRPEADQSALSQVPQDMIPTLAPGAYPRFLEHRHHLRTSQAPVASQRLIKELSRAFHDPSVEFQSSQPSLVPGEYARRRELQHPPAVLRRHEMERATHRPGPDDLPFEYGPLDIRQRRGLQAQADGPHRLKIVLRLDSAEPPHYLFRPLEPLTFDALVDQSPTSNVRVVQIAANTLLGSGQVHACSSSTACKKYSTGDFGYLGLLRRGRRPAGAHGLRSPGRSPAGAPVHTTPGGRTAPPRLRGRDTRTPATRAGAPMRSLPAA